MADGGIVAQSIRFALGLDFDGKGFGKAEDAIANLQQMAGRVGAALAGGYLFKQFLDMAYETADTADKLGELTTALNLNAEAYQKLSYAAKLNGIEQETLNGAFSTMYRTVSKAALGATGAAQKFSSIGVHIKDAGGNLKSTTEIFSETGAAIRGLKSPSEKTAAAIRIFGEGGARLVPLFNKSDEAIAAYGKELEDLGGVMDQDFLDQSSDFNDTLDRQRRAFLGVKVALTRAVLPALDLFAKALTWLAKGLSSALKHTRFVEASLVTLAGFFLLVGARAAWAGREVIFAWLKAAAPILAVVAALALVALAIDDVWTYLEGGDSIIGDLISGIGPAFDKLTEWLDNLTEGWGKKAGDNLAKGIGSSDVIHAILRVAKAINDYIILPLRAITGSEGALRSLGKHVFGTEKVQPAAYANADGSIDYTSPENQAKYGTPGPWANSPDEPFRMPGVAPSSSVKTEIHNQTTIEIKPVIQGSGLSASEIGAAMGQAVDERMQAHFDDAFSSLVPAAP